MTNCCDSSVCAVETVVVANVSWPAQKLRGYWYKLHGGSQQPRKKKLWFCLGRHDALQGFTLFTACTVNSRARTATIGATTHGWLRKMNHFARFGEFLCRHSCTLIWFASDNWEVKVLWQLHDRIIDNHYPHRINFRALFFARGVRP